MLAGPLTPVDMGLPLESAGIKPGLGEPVGMADLVERRRLLVVVQRRPEPLEHCCSCGVPNDAR